MRFHRIVNIAFVIFISACVSKESIVIPPAKPFDHPQLSNLSAQKIQAHGDTIIFGKSKKYTKNNRKIVYLQGRPFEIGYAHRKLMNKEIDDNLKFWLYYGKVRFLGTNYGINLMMKRAKEVEQHIPAEYLEELHGISVGSNLDYDTLLTMNALSTTAYHFAAHGCTSFAFRDRKSNIVRSRNLDWRTGSSEGFFAGMIIYIVKPDSGFGFFCVNRPGWIDATTAMNEMGLNFGDHYVRGKRFSPKNME